MTRDELLSRLERMEKEARCEAAFAGGIAWKYANDPTLADTAGSSVAEDAAHAAFDALALSEARAALARLDALERVVRCDCERSYSRHANDTGGHCNYRHGRCEMCGSPAPPTEEN